MKILFDENISHKLVFRLADLFPHSTSVHHLGMRQARDESLWQFARDCDFQAIITADRDFANMAVDLGPPPKIIRFAHLDFSTAVTEQIIRKNAIRIAEFLNTHESLLILDP